MAFGFLAFLRLYGYQNKITPNPDGGKKEDKNKNQYGIRCPKIPVENLEGGKGRRKKKRSWIVEVYNSVGDREER